MLGKVERQQALFFKPQRLRELIPDDHILVKVDRILNLEWLEEAVRPLYSEDEGRPSIPPETAMRLMLAGLILSIPKYRRLMREAQVNIAILWFAGYELGDKLPDHSSLSRIRERWGEELFRKTFKKVLQDCDKEGLLCRSTIHVDSTLIRADANIDSMVDTYLEDIEKENEEDNKDKDAKKTRVCTTDPDATMARSKPGQKFEPRYKAHVAVDDKCGVVVDVKVTTGSVHESLELIEQVKRVEENVGVRPKRVTADTGYSSAESYRRLEEMGIEPLIVPKREGKHGKCIPIQKFKYDGINKTVKCPAGKILRRSHRESSGWYYIAKEADCHGCRLRARCVARSQKRRKLYIADGYEARLRAVRRKLRGDECFVEASKRHKWMIEGRHAEAKVVHGMNRAMCRGLAKVSVQVLLTAIVMNLKRLVNHSILFLNRTHGSLLCLIQNILIPSPPTFSFRMLQPNA
jgi:IS5 family transposase